MTQNPSCDVYQTFYQWDCNQTIPIWADDIVYVDFEDTFSTTPYRIAVTDGVCRVPDEIMEAPGQRRYWLCLADQTRIEGHYTVLPRPIPPDRPSTPTEKVTFDELLEKTENAIEQASNVDVDAWNDEGETNIRVTNKEGVSKTVKVEAKEYDDTEIRQQIATINQTLSGKMEFYPVMLKQAPLRFVHMDGDVETVLQYTDLESKYRDPKYFLYCEYDLITFIPSLPPDDDPVHDVNVMEFAGVWHYDGLQRITAIKINERNEIKIEETVVPKDIKIDGTSIMNNGVANIPIADVNVNGVMKIDPFYGFQLSATRKLTPLKASNAEIEARTNQYRPITPYNLRPAVDSVLCSTKPEEALTPAQKVGFWNRVEKEWVLKGDTYYGE